MPPFQYPRDLLQGLAAEWLVPMPRDWEPLPLPDEGTLLAILEVAYHASFTADEQRRTLLELCLCEQSDAYEPFPLKRRRPFSAHELMRLAPAAGGRSVGVSPEHPTEIWGLCDGAFGRPFVKVSAPGSISIGRNGRVIAALRAGRVGVSYPLPFDAIAAVLESANNEAWTGVTFRGGSWSPETFVYPSYLEALLSGILSLGHGGAVLVVPERESDGAWRKFVRIKYECDDGAAWPAIRKAIESYDVDAQPDPAAEARATSLVRGIANLAGVDGAVVITDRFHVLGFGVEVTSGETAMRAASDNGAALDIENFGTRHRSAFRFAAHYPAGAAFVCSQDGAIRCFRTVADAVVMSGW